MHDENKYLLSRSNYGWPDVTGYCNLIALWKLGIAKDSTINGALLNLGPNH